MGNDNKMNEKTPSEVEKRFKKKGTITKKISIPLLAWEEWENDCKDNFNDTYYLKMISDHQYKKDMGKITQLLMEDFLALRQEFDNIKYEFSGLLEDLKNGNQKKSDEENNNNNNNDSADNYIGNKKTFGN